MLYKDDLLCSLSACCNLCRFTQQSQAADFVSLFTPSAQTKGTHSAIPSLGPCKCQAAYGRQPSRSPSGRPRLCNIWKRPSELTRRVQTPLVAATNTSLSAGDPVSCRDQGYWKVHKVCMP